MGSNLTEVTKYLKSAKVSILNQLRQSKKIGRDSKGMTLIEIMIVVVIIGGLASMLFSRVFGAKDKSNIKTTRIAMANLSEALERYNLDCNSYPSSLEGLMQKDDCKNWGPESYVKSLPKDAWNHEFIYEKTTSGFIIKSLGRDGKEGGSGYDMDFTNEEETK